MRSPRLKYSVLELDRAAEVPIPYRLFSHTKTQGRFHTAFSWRETTYNSCGRQSEGQHDTTNPQSTPHHARLAMLYASKT